MKNLSWLLLLLFASTAHAKQFEVFDGQFYNGLYYPLIDIIEWGEQHGEKPHMEFHVHSKDKPVDVTAVPGEKNGKPVLWLMFGLTHRGERVCRHVLAPAHFRKGMKLYAYRDNKDSDYDNVYVSSEPMKGLAEYTMPEYQRCTDENASNMPEEFASERKVASEQPASPAPASTVVPEKKDPKQIGVDYDNHAVPFSF